MQLPTLSRNIVISLFLAALAAVALFLYTSNVRHQATTSQSTIKVAVATRDLGPGTSIDQAISDGGLSYQAVRQSDAAPDAVKDLSGVRGQVLTSEVYKGDQLTTERTGSAGQQGLAYRISGTQRAMRISFKADAGLLADLQDGDRVDVFATYKDASGTAVTYLLARSALVLSVDSSAVVAAPSSQGSGDEPTGSAVISVPEAQAAALANALQGGADATFPLYLALTPKNHAAKQPLTPLAMPGDAHAEQ